MVKKDWVLELGERTVNPQDADEVLKDKVSERKRKQLERQEEIDEAAHKARLAELEKRAATSEASVDKVVREPQESPFKVKGEFNMGTIDFQARERELQAELKEMKVERERQLQVEGQVNQQLRDSLHQKELDILQIGLQAQIQNNQKQMENLIAQLGNKKNFLEEYTEAITTAKQLGVYNPQAGADATVQIELKKMEFEHNMALRKMMREEKQSDRQFQLDLRKWDDEREFKKQELEQKKKRDELLPSSIKVIGDSIAAGLMNPAEGGGEIAEEPPARPRGKQPGLVAGVGEAGETECAGCGQPIAIGPTARTAVCSNCGARYPIKRMPREAEEMSAEE